MTDSKTVLTDLTDRVMTITVSRPKALNALSRRTLDELADVLRSASALPYDELRGVIVTGAGERAFVAGADIREMSAMSPAEAENFGRLGQHVTELVERLPVPAIACVNGYALGGGCELAMSADFVYCTESAVFGQPEVALGLIPGFGGCVRLQRLVGPAMAKEMIYTGRRVAAGAALRMGLVNAVFPSVEQMLAAARETLRECMVNSPVAIGVCKATIDGVNGHSTEAALAVERQAFRDVFQTEDMRVGTRAFLAKERATFPGR
jgi:enoyl-CoA hydratase